MSCTCLEPNSLAMGPNADCSGSQIMVILDRLEPVYLAGGGAITNSRYYNAIMRTGEIRKIRGQLCKYCDMMNR